MTALSKSGSRTTAARLSAPTANARRFTPTAPARFGSAPLASASRKLPIRDYLSAIAIFVNAVKGITALQLGRDLDVQYKTAFAMAHKILEAIGAGRDDMILKRHG